MKVLILLAGLACLALPLSAGAVSVMGDGAKVTCGTTTPKALDDPSIDDDKYTRDLLVRVPKGAKIQVGPDTVTTAKGMTLDATDEALYYTVRLAAKTKLYCIAAASAVVEVQESY